MTDQYVLVGYGRFVGGRGSGVTLEVVSKYADGWAEGSDVALYLRQKPSGKTVTKADIIDPHDNETSV